MKNIKNIPIFQYGMNPNKVYISKKIVEKAINTFKNVPVIDYREDKKNVIGIVNKIVDIKNDFVYGDINVWYDIEVGNFYNYEIYVEDFHQENEISVIDNFKLMNISLEIKSE